MSCQQRQRQPMRDLRRNNHASPNGDATDLIFHEKKPPVSEAAFLLLEMDQ